MAVLSLVCEQCGEPFAIRRKRGIPRRFCDRCRAVRAKARKRAPCDPSKVRLRIIHLCVFVLAALAVLVPTGVLARDNGQWADSPANVRQWFQNLKQPDNPYQSCCGEADAFEADTFAVEGDHYVAVITEGRGLIEPGTRIPVPNFKMKWDEGNPTGHGIIFLSGQITPGDPPAPGYVYVLRKDGQARILYCYVAPGGV